LAYHQNASTHGPPTSSAVLANLGDFLCETTCETSEKRDQLGSDKEQTRNALGVDLNFSQTRQSPTVPDLGGVFVLEALRDALGLLHLDPFGGVVERRH
jgi:hypothetical protein